MFTWSTNSWKSATTSWKWNEIVKEWKHDRKICESSENQASCSSWVNLSTAFVINVCCLLLLSALTFVQWRNGYLMVCSQASKTWKKDYVERLTQLLQLAWFSELSHIFLSCFHSLTILFHFQLIVADFQEFVDHVNMVQLVADFSDVLVTFLLYLSSSSVNKKVDFSPVTFFCSQFYF